MGHTDIILIHLPALEREDREQLKRSIAMTENTKSTTEATTENTEKKPRRGPPKKTNPMRNNTFTTYMTAETLERLTSRTDEPKGETKNHRLQQDLITYWAMLDVGLAQARRSLTQREAQSVLDVLNGTYWDASNASMMTSGGLTLSVRDAIDLEGLDQKWSLDRDTIIAKLEALDRISTLALMDWARLFWANHQHINHETYTAGFQPDPQPEQ